MACLNDFDDYKREAIQAANDFRYGTLVTEKIKAAKTIDEIAAIMTKARQTTYKDVDLFPESVKRYDERITRESNRGIR